MTAVPPKLKDAGGCLGVKFVGGDAMTADMNPEVLFMEG